ncbi:MAG: GNAT family N-acetyltransferase [Streptosporangiaceae bacterium]
MTSTWSPPGTAVLVREVEALDITQFHGLGSDSGLHSLRNPARRAELLRSGRILGAFRGRELVGCACLQVDVKCQYIGLDQLLREAPAANVYLCSAFVRADYRGLGIGGELYSERLRMSLGYRKPCLIVEILGTASPLVPHPGAVAGYIFHAARGFRVVGYSPDDDQGPVLVRYEPHRGAAVARIASPSPGQGAVDHDQDTGRSPASP